MTEHDDTEPTCSCDACIERSEALQEIINDGKIKNEN